MARAKRARRYGPGESLPGKVPLPRAEDEGGTCGEGRFLRVNPLFDDHLTHASAHTESLWLTRWAREVEGMGSAAARHAAGGGSIELRLVELGHPECHRDLERSSVVQRHRDLLRREGRPRASRDHS